MKQTRLCLPLDFLSRIGFLAAVRAPIVDLNDELMALLFRAQRKAPRTSQELSAVRANYRPPQWVGYYVHMAKFTVTDGLYVVPLRQTEASSAMLATLADLHFPCRALPFVGSTTDPRMREPAQIILHEVATGKTFIEPWEVGAARLRDQHSAGTVRV